MEKNEMNDTFVKKSKEKIKRAIRNWRGDRRPRFITIYSTTRHYGGPEEGGWWYNWSECLETKSIPNCDKESLEAVVDSIIERWCKEYEQHHHGNIYSVLGGEEVWITLEHHAGERGSKRTPRYE